MNLLNIDNPMARPLSRAEEERLYGDDVADAQRADFAIERTLNVIKSGVDELEVGEYGRERDLLGQVLKLAAGRRDADVVASAVNELLSEVVKNRDPYYWAAEDERRRRINDAWRLSNNLASMACGLSIRSKA